MTLQAIEVPDVILELRPTRDAQRLIHLAHQKIETYTRSKRPAITNFVHCDFVLLYQALTWIASNRLLSGNRFCEWGSGFGVATLLSALQGMDAVGIEIEPYLVEQSCQLAEQLDLPASFYSGSFVPRDLSGILEWSCEVQHVSTEEDDVYDEMGHSLDEFDLFFAFPWPGEQGFFEAVFEQSAAESACLLSYRGRDGMHLMRKI